jgi:hypothetical protein
MKTGTTVAVKGWGVLSRGATLGRIRTPLVLRLLKAHGSLPAGTQIAIAFTASPRHLHQRNGHFKPVNFPVAASPFVLDGGLTKAARDNPVIAIASRYLGIPYVWGGSSPNPGFDCSGLVQYVYAKLGVSFVHFAASQYTSPNTVSVPPQRLAAGDLVFFVGSDGTREAPGHVGIYVQDGYFIDAPHTGSVVRVDSLADPEFAGQYIGARRVVAPLQLHHFHLTTLLTSVVGKGFIPHLFRKFLKAATYVIDRSTAGYRSDGEIAVVGVSGGSLLLILGGGTALVVRRRRREPADST